MKTKTIFISFSLGEGSVSDYFVELAKTFNKEYNVVIFSDTKKPENITLPEDIEIKRWISKRPTTFKDAKFLYQNIKKYKPVMSISIFGSVNIFLLVGFLFGIKHRIVWIRTLTTQFPQKKSLLIRKSIIYKLATKIIANSNATKDDAVLNYNIPKDKIKVLPNSVKDSYDSVPLNELNSKTITYIGRLHSSKGIETLINSFALVTKKYPDFTLEIIGSGQEETKLKDLVNSLDISSKVNFIGGLSKEKVLEKFKNTYIAVIPSISEAFGFTVIEAMSMKTLVIGANNTGIKETIIHNETGLLFKTKDDNDLAEKIVQAIENIDLRNRLAIAGYDRFLENYEYKKAAERDFLFFDNLLNISK